MARHNPARRATILFAYNAPPQKREAKQGTNIARTQRNKQHDAKLQNRVKHHKLRHCQWYICRTIDTNVNARLFQLFHHLRGLHTCLKFIVLSKKLGELHGDEADDEGD